MGETSTTSTINETSNKAAMKETDATTENLEADDLIFYHSLRNELNLLTKNPSLKTVHQILNYSKSLR
ncbi:MAG: hypothetical protein JWQ66_320 [Mucilaginibacter sp.]|jgi:hypothetical protein|nr:hypothetical protein [Mucilaginibacter sp.]